MLRNLFSSIGYIIKYILPNLGFNFFFFFKENLLLFYSSVITRIFQVGYAIFKRGGADILSDFFIDQNEMRR